MAAPYWGQLPPPNVTRHNSVGNGGANARRESLSIDTKKERLSTQDPKRNRESTQTEAPTISTQSPFVSPVASTFRGDGLAPRPPSYQYDPTGTSYNSDYLEKRRRRGESRNKDNLSSSNSPASPPNTTNPRRPPLPASYKESFASGALIEDQAPSRARPTRRSEAPVSPTEAPEEDNNWEVLGTSSPLSERDTYRREARSRSDGRGATRNGEISGSREEPRRRDTSGSHARKISISDAVNVKRRKEWAPDRSPLQRLELTLDSITKEEKRARVEEAEQLMREGKFNGGRPSEQPTTQNSVRFRNRPVARAPEGGLQSQPKSVEASGVPTTSNTRLREGLQRSPIVPERRPISNASPKIGVSPVQSLENRVSFARGSDNSFAPQRTQSAKQKPGIPIAVGAAAAAEASGLLYRSASNKLRKDPPPDHWSRQSDKSYQDTLPRRASSSDQHEYIKSVSRRATEPLNSRGYSARAAGIRGDSPSSSDEEMRGVPVRRGSRRKMEQLTGDSQHDRKSHQEIELVQLLLEMVQVLKAVNTIITIYPTHFIDIMITSLELGCMPHRSGSMSGRKLLDLEDIGSETEKDNSWWEGGRTGRKGSVKQRKAEAYDGEYDEDNGIVPLAFGSMEECAGCIAEQQLPVQKTRTGFDRLRPKFKSGYTSKLDAARPSSSMQTSKAPPVIHQDHSLTCAMRFIRVRPEIAPTRFKPPLLLKCGPLLRYYGLRTEKTSHRSVARGPLPEREIWRGSVMIVTQDSHSSYELAPTLRLFLQPVDLMAPPPAQVDGEELAPEYIDPIAGLPKIGRDGRTLYTRPVEHLDEEQDLSQIENDDGLFESRRSNLDGTADKKRKKSQYDGEKAGKYKEVRGFRLHADRGVTFWRFNIEVELRSKQQRIAYRINRGPATGFWVPARGQSMNIMFYSCNGFTMDVHPSDFNGPDPMWRDVLNTHQTQPFHVMLGGGDQLYNDHIMERTTLFKEWLNIKNPLHKESLPLTPEMQDEMEKFYLDSYCMWFSQGLFGVANSQIPMVNIFDDHDIIDGFGSYPDSYMSCPVMSGLGNMAFKYYMLFQQQTSIDEGEETEPSWLLGAQPGPYIAELSRSILTSLGGGIVFLGLDCRTERMNDEIITAETYHKIFDRLERDLIKGKTKHLIVLLGVPIAYPRLVWLESLLTSKAMVPIKAMGRAGILGRNLMNHFDGGVEILDDLDDHWTAAHHKDERNWLIKEFQDLAAEKSVRITFLGGDVHLGAIGQFYSNPKLKIPKDQDFRYMPNVISSAIANAPPPDMLADILNKRNKVHHLDTETDEDMIPLFTHDVDGKPRNNKRLLNRRNWCSIREYNPAMTRPSSPATASYDGSVEPAPRRGLLRRFTTKGPSYRSDAPPLSNASFFQRRPSLSRRSSVDSGRPRSLRRSLSLTRKDFSGLFRRNSSRRRPDDGGINGYGADSDDDLSYNATLDGPITAPATMRGGAGAGDENTEYYAFENVPPRATDATPKNASTSIAGAQPQSQPFPPARTQFHRTPTGLSEKQLRKGNVQQVNLENGLDICLNFEVNQKDPAGITMPYRLLVPALWYEDLMGEDGARKKREYDLLVWLRSRARRGRKGKGKMVEGSRERVAGEESVEVL
ncbi:Transcription factor protein [Rutstroemia sp. NJR-2017a BBW]|nr:Transcription factor protein [Rutstroemia sp. NJR-2017a BBW]